MRSADPTSPIEFKGANHQSMLKSFRSRPAAVLVTVREAPVCVCVCVCVCGWVGGCVCVCASECVIHCCLCVSICVT